MRSSSYEHPLPNSDRTVLREELIVYCIEKPRRAAQYREDDAAQDGELPLATWDGRAENARQRKVVLREEWVATRVQAGDYVHCVGEWEEAELDEEDERWLAGEGEVPPQEPAKEEDKEEHDPADGDPMPSSSFGSDGDFLADIDFDEAAMSTSAAMPSVPSRPRRTAPTMYLLSSSPLSTSPHADNLLILHPDILVTATAVCDVPTCVRKPLVRQRINGTGASDKMSEALVLGCMLHEVLQACLTGMGLLDDAAVPPDMFDTEESLAPYLDMPFPLRWYGPGRTNFSLGFVLRQAKLQVLHNLAGLLCCGLETSAAEEKLLDNCRPFGEFAKRYLEDTLAVQRADAAGGGGAGAQGYDIRGLFRAGDGTLNMSSLFKEDAAVLDSRTTVPTLARVTHVFDVEEEIWSPMYGLKGKMDVSVEVELQETEVDRPAWRGGNHFVPGAGAGAQQQRSGTGPGPTGGAGARGDGPAGAGSAFYRRTQSAPARKEVKTRYTAIMPMEIKTGRSVDALEHRAQTMLYTLMMSDRYGTKVDSGLLYYTRSGDMHRVRRTRNEVRGLIVGRNELAYWMTRDKATVVDEEEQGQPQQPQQPQPEDDAAAPPSPPEGTTTLPPTIDNERECGRCFAQDGCMLYRRTVDRIVEDPEHPSEIAGLYSRITSHLTAEQAAFYEHWERLLSLEEEDMVRFKRELWTMTAAAREELGRCFANMQIDPAQHDYGAGSGSGEVHSHTYRFVRRAMPGSPGQSFLGGAITPGDPCVLSIEPGMFSVAQGYILQVTSKAVTVGLDHHLDAVLERAAVEAQGLKNTQQAPGSANTPASHLDIVFRIDRDEYADGMAKIRFQLSRLFFSNGPRDLRHRELIVDLQPPRFDYSRTLADEELPGHLNEDQRAAVRKVFAAEDYALLLGMPGTGKTTTIAELIKLLVSRGKTILLASYTHSAVDTILRKLLVGAEGVRLLRLGNPDRVHADLQEHTLPRASTVEELDDLISAPNVVATTCLSTGHATFARRKFDFCIVDEASQITLPTCLGPLRFADKFVLVGDHFQLPPLVRNATARAGGLDVSLFKRLSEAQPEAVVYLTRQYRMNGSIMLLSNHLIYDGLLRCGNERVAKQVLHLPRKAAALAEIHGSGGLTQSQGPPACGYARSSPDAHAHAHDRTADSKCWLAALLDESCHAVFLDTDEVPGPESRRGRMVQNHVEASLVQQLARALVLAGVPPSDIAVITPYRQQLKRLQTLLLPQATPSSSGEATGGFRRSAAALKREGADDSSGDVKPALGAAGKGGGRIEVLTADRSQGRDKPVVLLSLVRSNDLGQRGIGELLNDWRRINVALTRAQRKVVIVGSQKTLSAAPLLEDFFALMREQGWIRRLERGADGCHPRAMRYPGDPSEWAGDEDEDLAELRSQAEAEAIEAMGLPAVKEEDSPAEEHLPSTPPPRKAPNGFVSASVSSSPSNSQSQTPGRTRAPFEPLQPVSQSSPRSQSQSLSQQKRSPPRSQTQGGSQAHVQDENSQPQPPAPASSGSISLGGTPPGRKRERVAESPDWVFSEDEDESAAKRGQAPIELDSDSDIDSPPPPARARNSGSAGRGDIVDLEDMVTRPRTGGAGGGVLGKRKQPPQGSSSSTIPSPAGSPAPTPRPSGGTRFGRSSQAPAPPSGARASAGAEAGAGAGARPRGEGEGKADAASARGEAILRSRPFLREAMSVFEEGDGA